jgi:hypothetical protein
VDLWWETIPGLADALDEQRQQEDYDRLCVEAGALDPVRSTRQPYGRSRRTVTRHMGRTTTTRPAGPRQRRPPPVPPSPVIEAQQTRVREADRRADRWNRRRWGAHSRDLYEASCALWSALDRLWSRWETEVGEAEGPSDDYKELLPAARGAMEALRAAIGAALMALATRLVLVTSPPTDEESAGAAAHVGAEWTAFYSHAPPPGHAVMASGTPPNGPPSSTAAPRSAAVLALAA